MTVTRTARILVISPIVPNPPDRGARVITLSLLDALRVGFDVTLLTRVTSAREMGDALALLDRCRRVIPVMAPERKSFLHKIFYSFLYNLTSIFRRRSRKQFYSCPRALIQVARELRDESFDVVLVSSWQMYEPLAFFPNDKIILLTQGIDWKANRKMSLLERNLMKKIQAVRKWLLEQPEELRAYRSARHVWTLTEPDRAVVQVVCRDGCSVDIMPLGLDIDFYAPSGMQRNRGEILFLGHLDEPANVDGLEFFARKVYPHISDHAEWSMTIVGGKLPGDLKYFGLLPEVEVVGRVPDVRPYLHRASCLVVPLRFGEGLKVPVLEAMAAGLPVVSSLAGMGGLPFEPGGQFLHAETGEEFAAQIKKVFDDSDFASALADRAAQRVSERFANDGAQQAIRELVNRRLSPRVAGPDGE